MSVEEMIESFKGKQSDDEYVNFNDDFRARIIALLRAGQEMRKSCYSDEPGAIAWDAALGEEP